MPFNPSDSFFEPAGIGPVAQQYQPVPEARILAPGASWTALYSSNGFRTISVAAGLTEDGEITVARFVDLDGAVLQGSPSTLALTADAVGVLNVIDNLPFASFSVTVSNNGASAATLKPIIVYQEARAC